MDGQILGDIIIASTKVVSLKVLEPKWNRLWNSKTKVEFKLLGYGIHKYR